MLYPELEVGLNAGILGQPVIFQDGLGNPTYPDCPDWSQNYAVNFTQPLYTGGKIRNFLIIFRSVLSPVAASAFYGNMLYRKTHQYMVSLSENITMADPVSAARYSQSLDSAIAGGHGINEATQMATNSLYMTLQNQGLLLAMKDISGWLLAITFTVAVVSAFIPFHKTVRVPVIRTGEDMV